MSNTIVTQRDTQLEKQRAGFSMVTLTNFTNDDEPTIAAGSVVEISGSLYSVTVNESITGWAGMSDGPVWIKLVPSGTDPFTAEYTATAPTWSDAKQGWYDGTGTDRYLAGLTKDGATGYRGKFMVVPLGRDQAMFLLNETLLTSGSGTIPLPAGTRRIVGYARGAGGAGGGTPGDTDQEAAGGGGGAFSRHVFRNVGPVTYTVGAGGTGAVDANGTAGGNTTIVVGAETITANGGGGGARRSGSGGAGGAVDPDADFTIAGESGTNGGTSSGTGRGGASGNHYVVAVYISASAYTLRDSGFSNVLCAGNYRDHPVPSSVGNPGLSYGGGGSGASQAITSSIGRAGGAGASGAVLLRFWGVVAE